MNNDNKTTSDKALEWWNNLSAVDKYTMDKKYKLDPMELWTEEKVQEMYKSEHHTETEKTIKEETADMWFFNDIDGDNAIVSDENGFILEAPDKGTGKELCNRWNNYPSLAQENKELKERIKNMQNAAIIDMAFNPLKEENKLLREALEIIISSPEWIKNYGGGEVDIKAKQALNQ